MNEPTHYIKARKKGKKRWSFVSTNGTNRLRVHAVQYSEEGAKLTAEMLVADNPDFEFKVVPMHLGK